MRWALSISLLLLAQATPAAAQAWLAQQCVAFGQLQYRKLDPAFDRILPVEMPAPTLERLQGAAGTQAVAAALTLRGRMIFRDRQPLETQFVCLLDPAEKPVFFYALPVPATRAAPTPFARGPGGTPAPPPQSVTILPARPNPSVQRPPEAPRTPLPASAMRLRGLVREVGGRLQFSPCDGAPMALTDRTTGQELERALRDLTGGQAGRPMFVELYGGREAAPGDGIAALEVRRAAVETAGCRERFDQREWIASGSEPGWRLEITAREMLLNQAGASSPLRATHGGAVRQGNAIAYAATEGPEFTVVIDERRCVDPSSGALFAYTAEIRNEGLTFSGCVAHNPAMPAP